MIKEVTSKWWIKIKIGKDDQHIVSVGKNSGNKAKMHGNWENVRNIHKNLWKRKRKTRYEKWNLLENDKKACLSCLGATTCS